MIEVVQKYTCDISGESAYSDSNTTLQFEEKTFVWDGKEYGFHCCSQCSTKVGALPITRLVELSYEVSRQVKSGKKNGPKAQGGSESRRTKSDGVWAKFETEDHTFFCPECGRKDFKKSQGLGMHVVRQEDVGHMRLYEKVTGNSVLTESKRHGKVDA